MAKPYKVEYMEGTPVDITEYVTTLDKFKKYSDGRISVAAFTLKAEFGQFITNDNSGTTPIINQFDKFKITIIDTDGNLDWRIFEMKTDLSQFTKQSEYLLPLELEGLERHLAFTPFSGYIEFFDHKQIAAKVIENYSVTRKTKQPVITFIEGVNSYNQLPDNNPNIWDFQYIDNCLDALKEIVKHANGSVPAGGAGDRFAIFFEDQITPGLLTIKIISQGSTNSQPYPILESSLQYPIQIIEKIKQPITGTKVIARGRPGSSFMPSKYAKYRDRLEFFLRSPQFSSTKIYPKDSYVKHNDAVYRAVQTVPAGNPPPNATYWLAVTPGTYIGNIQYSPYTKDKQNLYRNFGGNPEGPLDPALFTSLKIFDCNLVILEDVAGSKPGVYRNFVDVRSNTDDLTGDVSKKKYLFQQSTMLEGFRILVDTTLGAASGAFVGNDPNGFPYANSMCIFVEGRWYVFRTAHEFDQCAVRTEGRIYEWNVAFSPGSRSFAGDDRRRGGPNPGTFAWRDASAEFMGNDCFHSPTYFANDTGLIDPILNDATGQNYTQNSAIRIKYAFNKQSETPEYKTFLDQILGILFLRESISTKLASLAVGLFNLFATPYYTSAGWWWVWGSPFPGSTHNGISEQIGQLYGGDATTINEHRFFDAYNQFFTPTGKRPWNASDADDMMEITGNTFLYQLFIKAGGVNIPFTGDIPVSYWAIDNNGTIWKSKDVYRFLGDVQRFTFYYGNFTPVYRARTPLGIDNIIHNLLVPDLEEGFDVLFKNKILYEGFMLELSYDEKGRYMPDLMTTIIKPTIFNPFSYSGQITSVEFDGKIDAFTFIKTPIALSADDSQSADRAIFPDIKDYPQVTNIEQLQHIADAELNIEEFQYEQYTVKNHDRADRKLQETVYLRDQYLIKETDRIATPNTREVIVNEINYEVSKGEELTRTLIINKRIPKQ